MKTPQPVGWLLMFFTQYRWARRMQGGKWEEWYADPVNAWVWLDVADWTPAGKRPGGCAIYDRDPAPRAREDHSHPPAKSMQGIAALCFLLLASCAHADTPDQAKRWNAAKVDPRRTIALDKAVALYQRNAARYLTLQKARANGVPAPIIFGIHLRESDCSFNDSLAQGDPLTHKSRNVPANRIPGVNPPYTWEQAAIDALYDPKLDAMDKKNWRGVADCLMNIENWNGSGYYRYHADVPTPYLWSATNLYSRGKYTGDGRFDKMAVDSQLGVAAVLLRMKERGIPLPF